jgi:hypothetical protein
MTKSQLITLLLGSNNPATRDPLEALIRDAIVRGSDENRGTVGVYDELEGMQRCLGEVLHNFRQLHGEPFDSEPHPPALTDPQPQKVRVLIEVDGGCVSAVHCDAPGRVDCTVLDHDNPAEEGALENDLAVWFADGTTARKFLQQVALANPAYETVL